MNVRKTGETDLAVTLAWDPVAGAEGFIYTLDGDERLSDGKRHFTMDGAKTTVKIAKPQDGKPHTYGVVALGKVDTGSVTVPDPPPPPPAPSGFGALLPARLPASHGGKTWDCATAADVAAALAGCGSGDIINVDAALTLVGKAGGGPLGAGLCIQRRFDPANPVTIQGAGGRFKVTGGAKGGPYTYGVAFWHAAGVLLRNVDIHDVLGTDGASGSTGLYVNGSTDVEIDGYSVIGCGGQGATVVGDPTTAAYPVTRRIQFWNGWYERNGVDTHGGYYDVRGTHHMYIGQDQGHDDALGGMEGWVVANHVFKGTMPGYHIEPGPQARDGLIVNNTFYYNHSADAYARDFINAYANQANQYATQRLKVVNNVFYDSLDAVMDGSGATSTITVDAHNNVYGQVARGFVTLNYTLAANLMADPKLDLATLRLQAGSPAVGHGDPGWTPPTDHDGKPRATADCGAFATV